MIEKGLNIYQRITLLKERNETELLNELLNGYINSFEKLFIGGDKSLVSERKEALLFYIRNNNDSIPIEEFDKFKSYLQDNNNYDLGIPISGSKAISSLDRFIYLEFRNDAIVKDSLDKLCKPLFVGRILNRITDLISWFIKTNLLTDVLAYEQRLLEENGYAVGITEDFNTYFITNIANQKEWIEYFFEKYPVLIPTIYNFIKTQLNYISQFLCQLLDDAVEIEDIFEIKVYNNLKDIGLFNNALRNQNTHVMIIEFESGKKILYKPKDFKTETFFKETLEYIADLGLKIDTIFPKGIDRSKYSWVEFIETKNKSCKNEEEVRAFFYTQGQMLFVFYLFNSYDIGAGNILCSGNKPCFIDLEGLFSRKIILKDDDFLVKAIEEKLDISVQHVGMLPKWSKIDNKLNARMKSALTSSPNENRHLPLLEGIAVSGENYLSQIIQGFETAYRFVSTKRDRISKMISDKLSSEIYLRKILRSSSTYFTIRKQFFNPVNLTDGLKASLIYDHFWSAHEEEGYNAAIIESEIKQLTNLDVPVYAVNISSDILYNGELEEVSKIKFKSDVLTDIKNKLNALSEEDLDFQVRIIQGTFTLLQEQNLLAK